MAYRLDVHHLDVVAGGEVLDVGHTVDDRQVREDARQMGLLRSIGVANFMEENYLRLVGSCRVVPAVNQIETHVYRQQARMHRLLAEHGTWHESWSPLACGQNGFFHDPVLKRIADAHGKSIAQVGLRWLLQQGVDVIPKTTHLERMQENLDLFDFELTKEEMQNIKTLDTGRSQFGWW